MAILLPTPTATPEKLFIPPPSLTSPKQGYSDDEPKNEAPSSDSLHSPDEALNSDSCDDFSDSSEESEDETEYGFVTEYHYYPPEQLRKDMKEKMNSKEYIEALKSLKAEMENECPEKPRK